MAWWPRVWWVTCAVAFAAALYLERDAAIAISFGEGATASHVATWIGGLIAAALVLGFVRVRWRQPLVRHRASTLTQSLEVEVTRAANRLAVVTAGSVIAGILVGLWLQVGGRDNVLLVQEIAGVVVALFVYRDIQRAGPLTLAALAIMAPAAILTLYAIATGKVERRGVDLFGTLLIVGGGTIALAAAAWCSWWLSRRSIDELATSRLRLHDAPGTRPGRFASGNYLRVAGWSVVIGLWLLVRYLPLMIVGTRAVAIAGKPSKRTHALRRRRARASAVEAEHWRQRDPRIPILLIRSFADESIEQTLSDGQYPAPTSEDGLIDALWAYAPVITFGNPVERDIHAGALPLYMRDSQSDGLAWRAEFERIARQAPLIVAFVGATPSLAWELHRVAELGLKHKLVLLVPAFDDDAIRVRWQATIDNLEALDGKPYAGLEGVASDELIAAMPLGDRWVFVRAEARTKEVYQISLRLAAQLERPS